MYIALSSLLGTLLGFVDSFSLDSSSTSPLIANLGGVEDNRGDKSETKYGQKSAQYTIACILSCAESRKDGSLTTAHRIPDTDKTLCTKIEINVRTKITIEIASDGPIPIFYDNVL